jgi:hypothetical protein
MSYVREIVRGLVENRLSDYDEAIGPPTKAHAIKLVTNPLYARRNRNIKQEQHHYDKLRAWSQHHNIDMENTINGVQKHLRSSVAAGMQGLLDVDK